MGLITRQVLLHHDDIIVLNLYLTKHLSSFFPHYHPISLRRLFRFVYSNHFLPKEFKTMYTIHLLMHWISLEGHRPLWYILIFFASWEPIIRSELGAFLVAQGVNKLPTMQETIVQLLGQEDPLEKGTATHSSILAWRIP